MESIGIKREPNNRNTDDLRPISFELSPNRYAEGSCLVKFGHTHVLCTASVDEKVPPWLLGKGRGWVTAEYSMLPRSTHTRSKRDREKVSGRTHEIQRLIGRALRGMVSLEMLGERQIIVDCDVIQADGGTRTASITGGCIALSFAIQKLIQTKVIHSNPLIDTVSAVSIGIVKNKVLTDLDYLEDSNCDVDMNVVMTGKGKFIEFQGTAEKEPFSQEQLNHMIKAGSEACGELTLLQKQILSKHQIIIP